MTLAPPTGTAASRCGHGVDPFTVEIVRNFLGAMTKQMAVTLARTAYSPVIQHNEDFSTGVFTAAAELIVQGPGLAAHIIPIEACVRSALSEFPIEKLQPGDMIISNDPFRGGTHLPDVALIAPFFVDDSLCCFVGNRAHWEDIGGMVPGSMTGASTDLFQEGLIIPPTKIVARGEVREDLARLICENTRFPVARQGDLAAQMAANRIGLRNLEELVGRYGQDTALQVFARLMELAEGAARRALSSMRDGVYEYRDFNDNDGITTQPLRIRARATVSGDSITVDFTGTDPMPVGPCKSVRSTTEAAVLATLKCLISSDVPVNRGFFRPVEVIIPEGSFLNPVKPASVCGDTEPMSRVQDVVMALLASAVPEGVIGAQYGSVNHILLNGRRADGSPFVLYEAPCGGIGAGAEFDGANAIVMLMGGDVKNLPIEVLEQAYPVRCLGYRLRQDSGGPGTTRGGLGLERTYELLEAASASLISDRCVFAPFGIFGAYDAHRGSWTVDPGTDRERPLAGDYLSKATAVTLPAGAVLRIRTGGGGGYGDPLERAVDRVLEDVVRGWVSPEGARIDYGVVVERDGDTWLVSTEATSQSRRALREAQAGRVLTLAVDPELDATGSIETYVDPSDLARLELEPGDWLTVLGATPAPIRLRAVPREGLSGSLVVGVDTLALLGLPAGEGRCSILPKRVELT